jgi:ubiquitin-like-conjugating enzyme ATG10
LDNSSCSHTNNNNNWSELDFCTGARQLVQALEKHKQQKTSSSSLSLEHWTLSDDDGNSNNNATNGTVLLVHPPVVTTPQTRRKTAQIPAAAVQQGATASSTSIDNSYDSDDGDLVSSSFVDLTVWQDQDTTLTQEEEELEWRLSCVYSDTWRVPVLYLTVQNKRGSPCSRDELLQAIKNGTTDNSWDFLSAEEHPVTGVPCFFLHPCRTSERLDVLLDTKSIHSGVRLWSWLSMMVPALNMNISPRTFQLVQQDLLSQQNDSSPNTTNSL